MKKVLLLSLFVLIAAISVKSVEAASVMEPQWGEFCPPMYESAVFKKGEANSKRHMENNYWALRRVKFEKAVEECKAISKTQSELNSCFARVANIERNKSAQRREAKNERYYAEDREIRDGYYW